MSAAPVTDEELLANGVDPPLYRELMREGYWLDATIPEFARQNAKAKPAALAFESLSEGRSLTWRGYLDEFLALAGELQRLGIQKSDRVVLCLPDWLENHLFEDALTLLNAVTVRALLSSSTAELERTTCHVGAVAIVTPRQWRGIEFPELVRQWPAAVPSLRYHIVMDRGEAEVAMSQGPRPDLSAAVLDRDREPRPAYEVYLMTFTSGSTAQPKCVRHTSLRWVYLSRCIIEALKIGPSDSTICLAPHSSGLGIWAGHTLPIVAGIRSVMIERFSAEDALSAIEQTRPTVLVAVPAQLIKMLESRAFRAGRVQSLRAVVYAGAPLPYERARQAEELLRCPVLTVAGASDSAAFILASIDDPPEQRHHGWGRVVAGTTARLLDLQGRDIEVPYQEGMLAARGGFWSSGYLEDPVGTRAIFCPSLPDWQVTGDLWTKDENGHFRIVGRLKDIVIRGGQNISCAEVEGYVARHPGVSEVAAVRMPDPVLGERVCAYVVLKTGYQLDFEELVSFLMSEGIARYKLPERLEVIPEMPFSPSGKVLKSVLEKDIEQKIQSA